MAKNLEHFRKSIKTTWFFILFLFNLN
jgi:hypothetical protein